MGPVVAPAGTTAVPPDALAFVGTTSDEVLKRTPVIAVVKDPLIVTVEPTMPLAGEKVGTPGQVVEAVVVYGNAGVEIPVLLVTSTGFDPTPDGTVTSSWVSASI